MKKTFYTILIPLFFVTTVQICLKYPMTREIFTDIENYEGIKKEDSDAYCNSVVEIELNSAVPGKKAEILYNSEFIAFLDAKGVSFVVPCDGIVQIKNDSGKELFVDVNYNPEKLMVKNINREISEGIQTLCSVNYRKNN